MYDDLEHREVVSLLPSWANGTLSNLELAKVEKHVAACSECQRQSAQWRQMQTLVQQNVDLNLAATQSLSKLKKRIQDDEARRQPWWRVAWSRWCNSPLVLRGALLAQFGIVVALLFVWAAQPGEQTYQTLAAPSRAGASIQLITVVLKSGASEQGVRSLLLSLPGRVVDGPTPEGAYVVAVAQGQQAQALEQLRRHPDVALAEPSTSGLP